jgi:adenosylhomocysteine nucleosidase
VRRAVARSAFRPRIVVCGIGAAAAARAAEAALAGEPPHGALVVGLCGFLVPCLRVGEVVIYSSIQDEHVTLEIDAALLKELAALLPSAQSVRAVQSPAIVALPSAKAALAQRFGAQAVDMESFTLVEHLRRGGVAAGIVRVGSDTSDDELPDLAGALDCNGRLDRMKLARIVLGRPSAGLRLARNGLRALAALERTVEELCAYRPGATSPPNA